MGALGVHFALTEEQERALLAAAAADPDPDERVMELVERIEEAWDEPWLQETDKAWDAIHRCLTDGDLEWDNGDYPLNRCILGGQRLYDADDYIVVFVPAGEAVDVAGALDAIDEPALRARYRTLRPEQYDASDDDFEYVWHWFAELKAFFRRAAAARRSVVFTASQ